MNNEHILIQCLVLAYRETLLKEEGNKSNNLIKTILNLDNLNKNKKYILGKEQEFYNNLKMFILEYMSDPSLYSKTRILETVQLICKDKTSTYAVISNLIGAFLKEEELKNEIINTRTHLNMIYRLSKIRSLIDKANKDLGKDDLGEEGVKGYISRLIAELESMNISHKEKDPAILDEANMSLDTDLDQVVKKVKDQNNKEKILKTGWTELNNMTQGGFRRREMWMITAMQHNYKSGLLQSLFVQFCLHNKPILKDPTKKPAIIYISFEDDSSVYTEFIYKYLYYNNNNELPNVNETPDSIIQEYIKTNLGVNGYNPLTLRVNPGAWTYLDLFNKIIEYEAKGYEIHACIIDYLSKLPTTGCIGSNGTDIRELYQKCRMFFGSKEIALITAHQLSTEAKKLIKNGLNPMNFAEEVVGKGYTEGSGQLDQIVDGEIAICIAKKDKKHVLCFYRGKHRIPTILPDELKGFYLTFAKNAPLKETIHETTKHDDEFGDFNF